MLDKKKEFLNNFSLYFLDNNFKKKGNTFLKDQKDTVTIVNFQKSSFGESYYLNFGVFYKGINGGVQTEKLKIQDAHFFGRYEQILGIQGDGIDLANIENISALTENIILNISKNIIPFLENLSSFPYLKKILPKDIPWDRVWLQNITSAQLLKLIG